MEDRALLTVRKSDIDVTLGDLASGRAVAVDTHCSKMTQVNVEAALDDSAKNVVSTADIVVDRITLSFGRAHGVRGCALLSELNDRVGLLVLDQLQEHVVFLADINVKEFDGLARHFFPRLDANFRALDRRQGVATHLDVNVPPGEVVDNDNIMTLV